MRLCVFIKFTHEKCLPRVSESEQVKVYGFVFLCRFISIHYTMPTTTKNRQMFDPLSDYLRER